jgi:hypothetical protein
VLLLLAVAWLGSKLYALYLQFWVWQSITTDTEPNWGMSPLVIVPRNPHLTTAQEWHIVWSLWRQQLAQLTGSGLLGAALLGIVAMRKGREVAYALLVLVVLVVTVWGFQRLDPGPLNQLQVYDHRLVRFGTGTLLLVVAGGLTGLVRLRITRFQWLLWFWFLGAMLFFSLVGKVTRAPSGELTGGLDWRYTLFAHGALAVLAAGALQRCREALAGRRLASWLPAALIATVVIPNLIIGSNYLRQTAAYSTAQLAGVNDAKVRAEAGDGTVVTFWPYYYALVPYPEDYGPYRWREGGIKLHHIWEFDDEAADSGIVLYDAQHGAYHRQRLREL